MSKNPENGKPGDGEFARAMEAQGVKPLIKGSRWLPPPASSKTQTTGGRDIPAHIQNRREQAVREAASISPLSDSAMEWLGPHDIVEFSRPGLRQDHFRDLKRGKLRPAATLDLHRCTVEEARQLLPDFIRGCQRGSLRCVLVMHGKGFHSRPSEEMLQGGKAIARIKSFTIHWLRQMGEVLAISSAQPGDGGTGAVYVLLVK